MCRLFYAITIELPLVVRSVLLFISSLFITFIGLGQPVPPSTPAVVITEILYDMPGPSDTLEFIELTNPSDTNQRSLSGYSFSDGIEFTFPQGLIVEPGEVIVVAKDAGAMFRMFGVTAYQWDSGDLSDSGELIVLKNNFGIGADSVNYQVDLLWPDASGNGKSIVFCNDTLNNLGPTYWSAATTNTGVTAGTVPIFANPGTNCTDWVGLEEVETQQPLKVFPNPSTGLLNLELPTRTDNELLLKLFELNGKMVFSRTVEGSNGRFVLELALPSGMYLLAAEGRSATYYQRLMIME